MCDERLNLAVQGMNDGIWDWNMAANSLYLSPRYCELLGYGPDELAQHSETWESHLHPDERDRVIDQLRQHLEEHVPYDSEYRLRIRSGEYRWFRSRGQALWDEAGRPLRMAGSLTDINKRKISEAKLLSTMHQLQEATDLLVQYEKQATIARFAAGVAHEILNPTTIISSLLQMMESRENLSETSKEFLKVCREQIQRIVKISRDLRQAAHPNQPRRRPLDVGTIIRRALFLTDSRLKSENIQYTLDIAPDIPLIALDDEKIERMMINLIFNALEAMGRNKDKILKIALQRADESKGEKGILISVADNGIGIKQEDLPKIFEPFFTTKPPGKGTGLGLSACHGIVTEHGGKIWAKNNDAGGATFFVSLPVSD